MHSHGQPYQLHIWYISIWVFNSYWNASQLYTFQQDLESSCFHQEIFVFRRLALISLHCRKDYVVSEPRIDNFPPRVNNFSLIPGFLPESGTICKNVELMTADVGGQQWLSISGGSANNGKLVITISHTSFYHITHWQKTDKYKRKSQQITTTKTTIENWSFLNLPFFCSDRS